MEITILGTESLGARGLSCQVTTDKRVMVIDPGVALGYIRYGLRPHPIQVIAGRRVREKICRSLHKATDIFFTHYHGDHMPLTDANPYQLSAARLKEELGEHRVDIHGKSGDNTSPRMASRKNALEEVLGIGIIEAEGRNFGPVSCSAPVPHGERDTSLGSVMMVRIEDNNEVFVHASDIQLFDSETIEKILDMEPTTVLASGPPIYLPRISEDKERMAWNNALRLTRNVETTIIDHHLLRCERGLHWLRRLSGRTPNRVLCAADYMNREPMLLEAWRRELYEMVHVPEDWHDLYAVGNISLERFENMEAVIQRLIGTL